MQNTQSNSICTLRAVIVEVKRDNTAVMTRIQDMKFEPKEPTKKVSMCVAGMKVKTNHPMPKQLRMRAERGFPSDRITALLLYSIVRSDASLSLK